MNEVIPNEIISDGIGQLYYLLPIPFIAFILAVSIWLGFTRLNGETKKYYKLYNIISALILATVAYFFIPVDKRFINDIPTLIISIISSGVFVEIFVFWRKKKYKK